MATQNILHPHYGVQCISTQEYAKVFPYIRLTGGVPNQQEPSTGTYKSINISSGDGGTIEKNYLQKTDDNLRQQYDNLTWKTHMSMEAAKIKNKDENKNVHPILKNYEDDLYYKNYGTSSTSSSWTYESSNNELSKDPLESYFKYKHTKEAWPYVQKKVSNAIQYFMKNGEAKKTEDILHSPKFNIYEPFSSYPQLWRERYEPARMKTLSWFPEWIYLIYAVLLWLFITQGIKAIQPETYDDTNCSTSQYVRMWICFGCIVVTTNIAAVYFEGGRKSQLPLLIFSTILILLLIHPKPLLCHVKDVNLKYEAGARALLAIFLLVIFIILQVIKKKCSK